MAKDCDVTIIGKGVRHRTSSRNGHEEMAIPLKSVAATTPKSGAEEKLLEVDLIIVLV